jgi:hypothetical protein
LQLVKGMKACCMLPISTSKRVTRLVNAGGE